MADHKALGFEIGPTETPIIPLLIGPMDLTFQVWREILDAGVFTNPVVPPAVPEGGCRLRTSYMATHTDEQLDFVLEVLEKVCKKYGVL
jgi:8-amino-7-oxononanoate synthase